MSGAEDRSGQSGMALVELLAALSIVAVMSGLMLGFFGQLRVVVRLQDEIALKTELAAAAGHLQRTVEAARAVPLVTDGATTPAIFEGGPHAMRFVAVTRAGFRAPGLGEVRLDTRSAGRGRTVVQSVQLRRPEGGPTAEEAIVVDGLSVARFAYADASGAFRDSWGGQSMPRAVRISLGRRLAGRSISVHAIARLH
jgi:prepilin-type N-terminal cleavage/methylation domain-containing protein